MNNDYNVQIIIANYVSLSTYIIMEYKVNTN